MRKHEEYKATMGFELDLSKYLERIEATVSEVY
jgi:hypothetical protein